jgi:hypothetical protein
LPFNIPLKSGWNIIGFPLQSEADAKAVVQQLINRGTLIKVQDELGNAIEDFGLFGGWVNNIGNFKPCNGYKVKVKVAETLRIETVYAKSSAIIPESVATIHFHSEAKGNGMDHMNINLVQLPVKFLQEEDEIAVYDGKICVGAVSLQQRHLETGNVSIPVSARDGWNEPGFTEGNEFSLKVWKIQSRKEYNVTPEILNGANTFLKHESTLASLKKYAAKGFNDELLYGTMEVNCYPNPFNDYINIEVKAGESSRLKIDIINQTGEVVKELMSWKTTGSNRFYGSWDGTDRNNNRVATGLYYLRVIGDKGVVTKKITFDK